MTWLSEKVKTNGILTHYHRTGGDKPPLIIAHGVTDNGKTWSRFARQFEDRYDIIMYDQRGHGLSDAPDSGYSFDEMSHDLADLVTALGLQRVHLLGHSGGAVIATLFAARHPDRVDSLVLEDPAWGTAWGPWDGMKVGMAQWFTGMKAMTADELTASCRESNPNWTDEEVALWVLSKQQVHPNLVQTFDQPAPPWVTAVGQIGCPILLVTGDLERGALNNSGDIQTLASHWQNGRVAHISGSGHTIHLDQYEAYCAAVGSFLASVDAARR